MRVTSIVFLFVHFISIYIVLEMIYETNSSKVNFRTWTNYCQLLYLPVDQYFFWIENFSTCMLFLRTCVTSTTISSSPVHTLRLLIPSPPQNDLKVLLTSLADSKYLILQKLANVFEQPVAEQIKVFTVTFFQKIKCIEQLGFAIKCQISYERLMAYYGIFVCDMFCC